MLNAGIIVSIGLMLLIYLIQARRSRAVSGYPDPDRFFLSSHAHSKEEYGSAQIAYFLQMATIVPFFSFAFGGLWWLAAWNTVLYIIGILLFIYLLPRFNSGSLDLVGRSSTPHALIASVHREPRLRSLASWLSMLAFLGLTLFEMVWGTKALQLVLGGNDYLYYLSISLFALYLVTVLWIGGQRAEIRTAQWQLVIAYIGLHLITGWVLSEHPGVLAQTDAPFVFVAIFAAGLWTIGRRVVHWKQDGRLEMIGLNAASVLSLSYVLFQIADTPGFFSTSILTMRPIAWPEKWVLISMLFTLGWMPLVFQFVDMTNWQRLSALKNEGSISSAKSGLWQFVVESPLSWLFPIVLGLTAATFLQVSAQEDPWIVFLKRTTALPGVWGVASMLLVLGLICVFLSTANALMSATGYAWAYDVKASTSAIMDRVHAARDGEVVTEDERSQVTLAGRIATSVAIAAAASIYILLDWKFDAGAQVLGLFLAFFTPILSFVPGMLIPMRTGRAAHPQVAFWSMLLSSVAGVLVGFYSLIGPPIFAWLSTPVCFAVSLAIYVPGFLIWSQPIPGVGPEATEAGAEA